MSFKSALLSGAKGGSGSTYRNVPDNLRSTDTFELLVGVGTGRIRLAPGGLQNLFIDDVAVEDGQGKNNFTDFAATLFDGDPTVLEPVKLQLGSSAGMNNIGLTLANTNPNAPGAWVTGAITQAGVDFIDLRFVVQQLYNQTKNGVSNATASIEVELRPSGAADWINPLITTSGANYARNGVPTTDAGRWAFILRNTVLEDVASSTGYSWNTGGTTPGVMAITGKTTSPYVKELRIAVPNDGAYANKTWEIRCRLREIDYQVSGTNGENEVHRTISWESAGGASSEPIGGDEAWRGLSYLQLYGKASDQITGVPEVKGIYDLDMYLVPPSTVWDPATRTYTGAAWDGVTTQLAWTQCPAWQIKGVIENDLSGVSALAPGSTLNKWDALEASKWFAELVPDGHGGTQPRYSMNWFIEQPQAVNELVNYLAGAVGSFAWDEGDGRWRLKVEKPETPQVIFTKEGIAGEFIYQHTDIDTRFNDITAVYRDRDNRYIESRVRVFNQADIDATGHRPTSIVLVGCDNRQEALRRAYIRLLSALNEKRMVSFKTNRIAGTLEQFSVVGIADGDLNSNTAIRSTGRIVGMDLARQKITVRDTLRLEAGVAYQINLTVPNPDYTPDTTSEPVSDDWRKPTISITRNIVNTAAQRGDVYDLYLDQPLPANVPEFAAVALSAPGLPALPKQYRVLGVQPEDGGEWATVSAIEIYTSKWVESDNITEEALNAQTSDKTVGVPILPDAGMFHMDAYSSGTANRRVLVANWNRPVGGFIDGYKVLYQYNGGPWVIGAQKTQDTFWELTDPAPGTYQFLIYTIDRRGSQSTPLAEFVTIDDTAVLAPVAYLTNESVTVASASDGTGFDLANAGGQFILYSPSGLIPATSLTFSVHSSSGATATIDANGNYAITSLTADTASVTFRAMWDGFGNPIDKIYTIAKSRAGVAGAPGTAGTPGTAGAAAKLLFITSNRQTVAFDSTGTATPAVQTVTFNAQKQNTTAVVSWSVTDANGVAQNVANVLSAATGDQVTMTVAQFVAACNGTTGCIVKGSLTDGTTLTDQISVVKVSQGATGASGLHNAQVFLYQRAASAPAVPSVATTYTFATGALTGQNNGWSTTVPAVNGQPLWVTVATASNTTATDNIAAGEWAAPTIMAQDGTAGSTGANGLNTATVFLYKRAASAPAVPTTTSTYTFATGVLSGQDNGWTQSVPATNGQPCYIITATALGTGATDTIATGEWAAPTILAQDGAQGSQGPTGPAGPTISLIADDLTFDYMDGVAFNTSQVITLTATLQNTSEALTWAATNGVTMSGTGNTRTISIAQFSGNSQTTITVTGQTTGAKSSVTLLRNDQTTPDDSIIPDSGWIATAGPSGLFPTSPSGSLGSTGITSTPWRFSGGMRVAIP